jgi:sigma-E factor negative regulatory protein RseC
MITEVGIVTSTTPASAWIKTIRAGACESCSSKNTCGTTGDQKELIVEVKNTLHVTTGDQVVIGLETKPILLLTFFLYVFPIIMLILGALIGDTMAPYLKMNPSLPSMAWGFLFFGLSFYIIRKKNNSLSQKAKYKPFLVRKKPQVIPSNCPVS